MPTADRAEPEPAAPGLPLLKWVGGKKKLLPALLPHYGGQPTVVEPFFGGGALSFRLAADRPDLSVVANDRLAELVGIYEAVRDDVDGFIAGVNVFADTYLAADGKDARRAYYYRVRQAYMEAALDGPAPLFFLLWTAYSGLFRTGRQFPGRFNTSHGFGVERPGFYHPDRLRATAPVMKAWQFTSADFADTPVRMSSDVFLFCDPPYRGTYDGYTGDGFTDDDQLRLAAYVRDAAQAGAKVVYTNKDLGDGFYTDQFPGFDIHRVPIRYTVNRNSAKVGRPLSHEVVVASR